MEQLEFSLQAVDYAMLIGYAVVVIALGLYFGRQHENASDYFLAGRRMIWPLIGISLFASNMSSTTLVGLAGEAYSTGIAVFNYESMAAVVLIFGVFFFFPALLRSGVYTLPEFLERRYDSRARSYFSLLTLFLNIVVDTAGSLFAGALVLQLLFPEIPLWQTVALLALLAGIYTMIGGLAAVMYTDAMQAILLLIGAIVIAVAAFGEAGGWSAVMSQAPAEMTSLLRPLDDPGVPWLGMVMGIPLLGFYFWCNNQFMVQRVISAKDVNHGRWGALFAGALKLPVLFIMVLPGTAAILIYPELPRPDLVFPTLMFDLLPTGLLGLVLAGFIAALMSQIDSTLNSASTPGYHGLCAPGKAGPQSASIDADRTVHDRAVHAACRCLGTADRKLWLAVQIPAEHAVVCGSAGRHALSCRHFLETRQFSRCHGHYCCRDRCRDSAVRVERSSWHHLIALSLYRAADPAAVCGGNGDGQPGGAARPG